MTPGIRNIFIVTIIISIIFINDLHLVYSQVKTETKSMTINITTAKDTNEEDLKKDIKKAIEDAAKKEKDEFLKDTLDKIAKSDQAISNLAKEIKDTLEACYDACTLSITRVKIMEKNVAIGVISIISLPSDEHTKEEKERIKKHEEGHAKIDREIAEKLGPKLAEKKIGRENIVEEMIRELKRAQDKAHEEYDKNTEHGRKEGQTAEDQIKEADKAIEEVVNEIMKQISYLPIGGPEYVNVPSFSELSLIAANIYENIALNDPNLIEDISLNELTRFIRMALYGVDFDLDFGRNADYAISQLTELASKVQVTRDSRTAKLIADDAINYAQSLLEYATIRGIVVEDMYRKYDKAYSLFEIGKYNEAIFIIIEIARTLLPKLFPEYQETPTYAIYFISVYHSETGRFIKDFPIILNWPGAGYSYTLKTNDEGRAIIVGPADSFTYQIPVKLNLLGLPILDYIPQLKDSIVWARGGGYAQGGGIIKFVVSISTLFIPIEIAILLVENILNIILFIFIFLFALRWLRKYFKAKALYPLSQPSLEG